MTKLRCLLVQKPAEGRFKAAEVPDRVRSYLAGNGVEISEAPLGEEPSFQGDLVIVHVPENAKDDDLTKVTRWLDAAEAQEVRAGLTGNRELFGKHNWLFFIHPAVHPVMPLNVGTEPKNYEANEAALTDFLGRAAAEAETDGSPIEIGWFFQQTDSLETYEQQRFMSLASEKTRTFVEDLQSAIALMSVPFPASLQGRIPPWDPFGPSTGKDQPLAADGSASLTDLFARYRSDERARKILAPGDSGWRAPKLLILGESGTGKSLVARLLWDAICRKAAADKPRLDLPLVTVNCAVLTGANVVHNLFGSADAAWTGVGAVVGDLARASYGVAFLDEIGDLEPQVQRAMLVYLQDGMIRPTQIDEFQSHTRVVAATNRDVTYLIERQQFRNDLFERFPLRVQIPPLRDRKEEIDRLIDFVALNPQTNPRKKVSHIAEDAMTTLKDWDYRNGNFRELETMVHAGIARARRERSKILRAEHLRTDDPRVVNDREANLISIRNAPPAASYVDVTRASDLDRLASFWSVPVLQQGEDGPQYVVTREAVFRYAPTPAEPPG